MTIPELVFLNLVSAVKPITWAAQCKYNAVLTNSHASINERPGINKLFSLNGSSWVTHAWHFNGIAYLWTEHPHSIGVRLP